MSNSVDPDEPSHLGLRCLQKPIIIAYGSERVHIYHALGKFSRRQIHDIFLIFHRYRLHMSHMHIGMICTYFYISWPAFGTANPLYTGTRYNDKIRYTCNDNLTGTKSSIKRCRLIRSYARTLYLILQETYVQDIC